MDKLYHYSKSPVILDRTMQYEQCKSEYKPCGFWLSVGESWKDWCYEEEFNLDTFSSKLVCRVVDALVLSSVLQIREFHANFMSIEQDYPNLRERMIDWRKVAQDYSGIVIAPYQWDLRLDLEVGWYCTWDCASGCMWDLNCIEIL